MFCALTLSVIMLNIVAVVIMRLTLHKIKFESLVLISGIIELSLLTVFQFFPISIFPLLIQSLQITIVMFISRRFLKQYLTMRLEQEELKVHNYYFGILLTINIAFISTICYFYFKGIHEIEQYIMYIHTSFSLVISIVLLFLGMKISKVIKSNIAEAHSLKKHDLLVLMQDEGIYASTLFYSFSSDNKGDSVSSLIPGDKSKGDDDVNKEKKKKKRKIPKNQSLVSRNTDIHSKTRQKQLFLIVFTNLITDLIEFITHSLRNFVFKHWFDNDKEIHVLEWQAYVIYTIEMICLWFSSLANYLTFYCIVRNSFKVNYPTANHDDKLFTDEIENYNKEEKHNNDIDDYLSD